MNTPVLEELITRDVQFYIKTVMALYQRVKQTSVSLTMDRPRAGDTIRVQDARWGGVYILTELTFANIEHLRNAKSTEDIYGLFEGIITQ